MEENAIVLYRPAAEIIKTAILQGQYEAAKGVNRIQLAVYFGIGKFVSQKTRKGVWGTGALEAISQILRKELPGLKGYSASSMKNKVIKIFACSFGAFAFICLALMLICKQIVVNNAEGKVFSDIDNIKYNNVGLLLGTTPQARIGRITNAFFTYRIDAAEQLYKAKDTRDRYLIHKYEV